MQKEIKFFIRSKICWNKLSWLMVEFSHTVRNLHFLSKNSTLISRENCRIFWVKNLWRCFGLGLFYFTRKIVKKIWVKNSWSWCFVKIEFLDKNFTFRVVWVKMVIVNVWITCLFLTPRNKNARNINFSTCGTLLW